VRLPARSGPSRFRPAPGDPVLDDLVRPGLLTRARWRRELGYVALALTAALPSS